ncbi:programmed cell death protein 2-like [Meriones unguiculatus]|uniref:programmed cell death protein 2-like n=1 Tax=Meriones unguiculatus TaxID=10047 RepID=UPI000B4F469A|nr:programmed cell death protein 2-like [Meriones unguiculatus]
MAAGRRRVLLGLRDAAVDSCPKGPAAWTASKLGGFPDALPAVAAPRPRCGRCEQRLSLVVQVYCPLEGSPFHRLLHVFACARPGCGNGETRSWKVYRSQCLQVPPETTPSVEKQDSGLEAEKWCEDAQDWGSDNEETLTSVPTTSDLRSSSDSGRGVDWAEQLQALHIQDTTLAVARPSPSRERLSILPKVPQFQPYYICVAEEDDYRNAVNLDHAHSLLREYQQREGVDMEQLLFLCDADEKYEKAKMKSGDQTFYKFMKRIAVCQEQIMRYSWNGEPLFLACPTSDISDIPVCSGCGGERTFECQLMPALVSMLSSDNLGLTVEFGTILIYTCEKSCWPPNQQTPMEEFCVIQEDPDEFLLK